ncbi:AGAP004995-PA-like protein [Anopheles sinensis]|uniref:AGAP004995-PA-like protein n=1 Tax=Anopheles sinensis TaxID=74873 RepID=A0A084WDW5_ANOSI|nr:AGAP004995-PA-like protein [Anopheles sinensis]
MGRINKLETDVELDVVPGSQHHPSSNSPLSSSGLSSYAGQGYEHYGKEFFFGNKHRDMLCTESEDSYLRPPLWEDIASSIQNIDPENAIMLGSATMNGVPQVKMEAVDDPNNFLPNNGTSNGYTHNGGNLGVTAAHGHQRQMYHSKYAVPQSTTQSSTICPTPISRLMYVPPLTPPNSDPGSPGNTLQVLLQQLPQPGGSSNQPAQPNQLVANSSLHAALTPLGSVLPAPSGPASSPSTPTTSGRLAGPTGSRGSSSKRHSSAHSINSVLSSAGVVKHIVGRYNRRNNPELEKRRIHHCDFIGKSGRHIHAPTPESNSH